MTKKIDTKFKENLKYVIQNLKQDIDKSKKLEDKTYFELSKNKITDSFKNSYNIVKSWEEYYDKSELDKIVNNYKEVESETSDLEMSLAEYDDDFHVEGISYTISILGKLLIQKIKEG